jgi:hypothetical protein
VTSYEFVNSSGLLLDIVGIFILFRTGLPSKAIRDTGVFEAFDPKMVTKYDRWAFVALVLLVFGFSLQIASNFVQT